MNYCGDCVYRNEFLFKGVLSNSKHHVCTRFPPHPTHSFPKVSQFAGCGEFVAKEKEETFEDRMAAILNDAYRRLAMVLETCQMEIEYAELVAWRNRNRNFVNW